ncbi:IgGFc-binding protein-like [Phaenicophaeus curvirostris]|uniref:IgGFc-binding protein-like n=1 Tax=Phaenicophaeus curvirostris TaxID=33595 RepID=UPI0037F0E1DB
MKTNPVAVSPLGDFCASYRLRSPPDATIVVAAGPGGDVTVDGQALGGRGWRRAPGEELWWREVTLGDRAGSHSLKRLNGTFAVVTYGQDGASWSRAECECDAPNACDTVRCPLGSRCRLFSCRPRCEALPDASCRLHRDLRTFSGSVVPLPVPCRYVLARRCHPDPSSVPPFSLEAQLTSSGGSSLLLRVYNLTVATAGGQEGRVQVNNDSIPLPASFLGGRLRLSRLRGGSGILLETNFSLRVTHRDGSTTLSVPGGLAGSLCGLCGDVPGEDSGSFCHRLARGELFRRCRGLVEPREHLQGCLEEACGHQSECRGLESFARACGRRGVDIPDWRREEGCASSSPENVSKSFQEIPECNQGFVFLNGSCVARRCLGESQAVGCHLQKSGRCSTRRDQSYVSFDGHHGSFGGSCLQELVGTCEASQELVAFRVWVKNEGRRPHGGATARSVKVHVHGHNVTLSHRFPGRALVDDLLVHLPHLLPGGSVSVSRRGWGTSLVSSFGLRVSFDGQSHVAVAVPSSYSGSLCGLCGDFDGDPRNDVPTTSGPCEEPPPPPPPPPCSHREVIARKQRVTEEECGLLLSRRGPFRPCHLLVEPESFFQACVHDYCVFRGHRSVVCGALTGYAAACQEAGGVLEAWRSKNVCAPACPPRSHYLLNGTSCPATCGPRVLQEACDLPGVEGCFCDQGLVLSGERCVSPENCGCHHEGRYHRPGEDFYPQDGCSKRCRCTEKGTVTCWEAPCPPGHRCGVENGIRACHSERRGRCLLLLVGSRRLVTFDGANVAFRRACRDLLVEVGEEEGGGRRLEVVVEEDGGVSVLVEGSRVSMRSGMRWRVEVDGEPRVLPLSVGDGETWLLREGNSIVLQTPWGLRVVYAATSILLVTVPGSFSGKTGGLCGDFDGHEDNDLDAIRAPMEAWKTPNGSIPCSGGCRTCLVHPPEATGLHEVETSCEMLVVAPGPFSGCHGEVDPKEFLENCLQEVVAGEAGGTDALCRSLQAYAVACQEAGATLEKWRNESFCPLPCGDHSSYSLCAGTCQGGCALLGHRVPCHRVPCFEGCRCAQGFYSDGHRCVLPSTCGCFHHGRYLQVMESLLVGNCTQRCTCYLQSTLLCEASGCSSGCEIRDGQRTCLAPGGP